jgi:hypothetical protein
MSPYLRTRLAALLVVTSIVPAGNLSADPPPTPISTARAGADRVLLERDPASGRLWALVTWAEGWSLHTSYDEGTSWFETYFRPLGFRTNDVAIAIGGGHLWVAYVTDLAAGAQDWGVVTRFGRQSGQLDAAYGSKVFVSTSGSGESIEEVALASNAEGSDDALWFASRASDGDLIVRRVPAGSGWPATDLPMVELYPADSLALDWSPSPGAPFAPALLLGHRSGHWTLLFGSDGSAALEVLTAVDSGCPIVSVGGAGGRAAIACVLPGSPARAGAKYGSGADWRDDWLHATVDTTLDVPDDSAVVILGGAPLAAAIQQPGDARSSYYVQSLDAPVAGPLSGFDPGDGAATGPDSFAAVDLPRGVGLAWVRWGGTPMFGRLGARPLFLDGFESGGAGRWSSAP